jgi:tRNA(adenine34) deaminase
LAAEFDAHEGLMRAALAQARLAAAAGEVPIGAVVAMDDRIIAAGFNQPIGSSDPTAHAEIVAIRAAANAVGNYRLTGATVCVTVEPCAMCVGAIVHARIGTLIYGAPEPKTGAVRSTMKLLDDPSWNHRLVVVAGLMADDCRALLQDFFVQRRQRSRP